MFRKESIIEPQLPTTVPQARLFVFRNKLWDKGEVYLYFLAKWIMA
jgi:hypothetical protein